MKTAAIISEYNPFHNGHEYHIAQTREQCGASHVVAVMSGDFVQRGDAACADKHIRARIALQCGVDLVVELPVPWAMAGAETFARGGVGIAAGLGCVDVLSFGSECGDAALIQRAAKLSDSPAATARLRELLADGASYAAARAASLTELDPECARILSSPNDTLGVEYCRALARFAPDIQPFCVKRTGAAHDYTEPYSLPSSGEFAAEPVSASYIRRLLADGNDLDSIMAHMPSAAFELLSEEIACRRAPSDISRLDRALVMKLRSMSVDELSRLPDVSEGLEHRIAECASLGGSDDLGFIRLCDNIKCKRYTHAKIRRILLSALLGLTADDCAGTPPYIRVLAMNGRGKEILSEASSRCSLPIITRFAQTASLDERGKRVFALCAAASDMHGLTLPVVPAAGRDFSRKLIIEQ